MEVLTIAENEDFLRQVSAPVDFDDETLKSDIKALEEYCKKDTTILALASVQIGIPKRLIYLKITNLDLVNRINSGQATEEEKNFNEARILINPVIISREGLTDYWESCASCLDNFGHIRRPYKIVVEYYDINGNKYTETFEGFETTVLCHELDHLDGILHIDIADELLHMEVDERKEFRKTHGYNIVSKTGTYEYPQPSNNSRK